MSAVLGLIALAGSSGAMLSLDEAPMTDAALDEARGGFTAGGYDVEFGFVLDPLTGGAFSVLTDGALLEQAIERAGGDFSPYRRENEIDLAAELSRTVVNTQDAVVRQMETRIDLVVQQNVAAALNLGVRQIETAIGVPTLLPSF